jgi:hypothetical protein
MTDSVATPNYIQLLQAQLSKMSSNDTKSLFVMNKWTLNRVIKLLIRDEAVRTTARNFQRNKNPGGKIREISKKDFIINPINY